MHVTVPLPDDLAQRANPVREALEAFAIEGFRSGAITAPQVRELPGFETRYELDGFLKAHQVWERSYTIQDLEKDVAHFEEGLLQAEGGELIGAAEARSQIEAMKDDWRLSRQ